MAMWECSMELDFTDDKCTTYEIDLYKERSKVGVLWTMEVYISTECGKKLLMRVEAATFELVLMAAISHPLCTEPLDHHLNQRLEEYEVFNFSLPGWAWF